jgi:DNA polymerase-3 subunit epsilon
MTQASTKEESVAAVTPIQAGLCPARAAKPSARTRKPTAIPFSKFASLDFETADYGRDSACAVAVVVVDKGEIVEQFHSLIRPPRRSFVFSYLHGITWNDVAQKPAFGELWPQVARLLQDVEFVAAHNASFDRGVLHACCATHGVTPGSRPYLCTMKLARRLWSVYPTKLSDVCRHFSIPLNHHEALSDALACARIVMQAAGPGVHKGAFLR